MRRAQRRPIFKLDFSFVGIEVVKTCVRSVTHKFRSYAILPLRAGIII